MHAGDGVYFILDDEKRVIFCSDTEFDYSEYVSSFIWDKRLSADNCFICLPPEHEGDNYIYVLRLSKCYFCFVTAGPLPVSSNVNGSSDDVYKILNYSFDGMIICDEQTRIIFLNKAFESICGITPDVYTNKSLLELVKLGFLSKSIAANAINKGKRVIDFCSYPRTGRIAQVISTPIFDESGKLVFVVSNIRESLEAQKVQSDEQEAYYYEINAAGGGKTDPSFENMMFFGPIMKDMMNKVEQIKNIKLNILITGETGTGKSILAEYIHKASNRRNYPFIKVNCAALPESLIESELFGYEKGAFTGALKEGKGGLFGAANKGVLFLDEIGDLPNHLQTRLLDFLQYNEYTKIGSTQSTKVDVQVIAATNQNLQDLIRLRKFRSDLFYRLNVISFHLPPLRERQQEILPLVAHFIKINSRRFNKSIKIPDDVLESITNLPFYGNVRELEHLVQGLFVLSNDNVITTDSLRQFIGDNSAAEKPPASFEAGPEPALPQESASYKDLVNSYETELIKHYINKHGTVKKAAEFLQIHPTLIWRKLKNRDDNANRLLQK